MCNAEVDGEDVEDAENRETAAVGEMIPRITSVEPQDGYRLIVQFDEGWRVVYDVGEDIRQVPAFADLRDIPGLFGNARLDSSRTIVVWNDEIDLSSDTIYEYGQKENG